MTHGPSRCKPDRLGEIHSLVTFAADQALRLAARVGWLSFRVLVPSRRKMSDTADEFC